MIESVDYQEPLSTKAQQVAHYRAVKRRLWGSAMNAACKAAAMPAPPALIKPAVLPPPPIPKIIRPDGCPLLADIKAAVCEVCQVPPLELESPRRWRQASEARHIFMFVARHYTARSLPYIGKTLGNRDHTTVLHGIRCVSADRPRFEARVMAVVAKIGLDSAVLEKWGTE